MLTLLSSRDHATAVHSLISETTKTTVHDDERAHDRLVWPRWPRRRPLVSLAASGASSSSPRQPADDRTTREASSVSLSKRACATPASPSARSGTMASRGSTATFPSSSPKRASSSRRMVSFDSELARRLAYQSARNDHSWHLSRVRLQQAHQRARADLRHPAEVRSRSRFCMSARTDSAQLRQGPRLGDVQRA